MAELLSARGDGLRRGLVGLTFDDGYQDFVTYAMPILQRYGFTATTFVLASQLGGHNAWDSPGPRKDLLTADQVREAARSGMEIGSHGLEHVPLCEADETQLSAETGRSRVILQQLTGQQIRGFCYPWGKVDARVMKAVQTAGYNYACAIWASPAIGRYAIPRTYVHDRDTWWRLDAKRLRAGLIVGNRIAVRRHRHKSQSSDWSTCGDDAASAPV
jgi:peptidoglycan/xylan/chitin deacetylase (PgdA/CDA1 family)